MIASNNRQPYRGFITMKITMLLILLALIFPLTGSAETINFSWTANSGDSTTGYEIIMDNGKNVIISIHDKSISSATYETIDNECHRFSIYAYNADNDHSDIGNMISYCPKPDNVVEFNLEVTK